MILFFHLLCVSSVTDAAGIFVTYFSIWFNNNFGILSLVEVSPCDQNPYHGVNSLCRASFPAWYYDKIINKCLEFIYGGCLASQNLFGSFEDCQQECVVYE